MHFRESETVELKQVVVNDIKKEIIAFANCDGGELYIGVNDNGEVVGVTNTDEVIQQISNMMRDAVKPDITMFLHYDVIEYDRKQIVAIIVQRGTNRPYYLVKKGLCPEGVYVRQGTSSVPATDAAIRHMIKETDGDSFEELRSQEQMLTFETTNKLFAQENLTFGNTQKQTMGLINTDGIYTNLGQLLSEQCVHTIKVAVFEGTNQNVFKDRREFAGSLLQQLNEVYDYIDFHNQIHSTFDKLYRIDNRDYPEVAVREALLNSLVHRDYAFSASTIISIYDDRIEFVSIGGLLSGVTLDDVMLGLSVCRNPKLANVFYRLKLIEAYGTGMQKILNAYAGSSRNPEIKVTQNAFKIILPNRNTAKKTIMDFVSEQYNGDNGEVTLETYNPTSEEVILNMAKQNGVITRREVENLLAVSQSTAGRLLKKLLEKGELVQYGQGKNTEYYLVK